MENVHQNVTDVLLILHGIKSDAGKPPTYETALLRTYQERKARLFARALLMGGIPCARHPAHAPVSCADKYFETMSSIVRKAKACSTVVLAPEWRQR